jgi:hypothetical protein
VCVCRLVSESVDAVVVLLVGNGVSLMPTLSAAFLGFVLVVTT